MKNPTTPNPSLHERLAAESGWLRRLAASLVRDPGEADDAVQDVLVSELGAPGVGSGAGAGPGSGPGFGPGDGGGRELRLSLFRRLRTRTSNRRREAGRRAGREKAYAELKSGRLGAAADEGGPEGLAIAAETADLVMEEVMGLGESHRSILLLSYFEGRSHREIAGAMGATTEVVRARLHRARAALRERLDARAKGGREEWLAAVGVLARPSSRWTSRAATAPAASGLGWGGLLAWGGGLAAAALVGAFVLQLLGKPAASEPSLGMAVGAGVELGSDGGEELARLGPGGMRAAPRAAAAPGAGAPRIPGTLRSPDFYPKVALQSLSGRVVDGEGGAPLEGARIRVLAMQSLDQAAFDPASAHATTRTDKEGRFEVSVPSYWMGVIEAVAPGRARAFTQFRGFWPEVREDDSSPYDGSLDEDIVMVRGAAVAGRAINGRGEAIAGARVLAFWPNDLEIDSFDDSEITPHLPPLAVTDDAGQFSLVQRPERATELVFMHPDYLTQVVTPPGDGGEFEVVLSDASSISGRVEGLGGDPGRGLDQPLMVLAVIAGDRFDPSDYGGHVARVETDGSFSVGGLIPGDPYELQVFSGAIPSRYSEPRSMALGALAGDGNVTIELSAGASVSFQVVDSRGAPIEADLTVHADFSVGRTDDTDFYAEGLFRTPVFTDPWSGGRVRLERLVARDAERLLYLQLWASGYESLDVWFDPPLDGDHADLGQITMALAPEPFVFSKARIKVTDAQGDAMPGAVVEQFVEGERRAAGEGVPAADAAVDPGRFRAYGPGQKADGDGGLLVQGLRPGLRIFRVAHHPAFVSRGLRKPVDGPVDSSDGDGPAQPWSLLRVAEGGREHSLTIQAPPRTQVRGTLVADGAALEGAAVAFARLGSPASLEDAIKLVRSAATGGDFSKALRVQGNGFEVPDGARGAWHVLVCSDPSGTILEGEVLLEGPRDEPVIELRQSIVTGVVLSAEGAPVEGALVSLWDGKKGLAWFLSGRAEHLDRRGVSSFQHRWARTAGSVLTGADGAFEIGVTRAPASGWSLVVEHDDFATAMAPGLDGDGGLRTVMGTIRLEACGEIRVRASGRSDLFWVDVERVGPAGEARRDDYSNYLSRMREGFVVGRVPVGRVRVRAFVSRDKGWDLGIVDLGAGETAVLELDPKAEAGELSWP